MDGRLEGGYPRAGAYVASSLALQCVREAKSRPPMSEVVIILERILTAGDIAGPSQSVQLTAPSPIAGPTRDSEQSAPDPVGRRSPVGSGNPSPLLLSPRGSSLPARSPQLP